MRHRFVDEALLDVASGHGGAGCVSFRREKCVEFGGPNGGDGGRGGDVIMVAEPQLATLLDYRLRPKQHAANGLPGAGNQCSGPAGADCIIKVPVGTLVFAQDSDEPLADLATPDARYVLAEGGRGGKGNTHFKSSTHQAPRFAQPGEPGQQLAIRLELRLLADVGLVGLPNVGKSATIAQVSACRPKIADYPFTTLVPNLGVIRRGWGQHLVIADVPGLVAGAHRGLGLGCRFLRHLSRVRCLVHVMTVRLGQTPDEAVQSAWQDLQVVEQELLLADQQLSTLPRMLLLNRLDLPEVREAVPALRLRAQQAGLRLFAVSAATGEGMRAWLDHLWQLLAQMSVEAAPATPLVLPKPPAAEQFPAMLTDAALQS